MIYIVLMLIIIAGWVGYDIVQNNKIPKTVAKDENIKKIDNTIDDILIALEKGVEPDYSNLPEILSYIDARYDTADFMFPSIIRILYGHKEKIPEQVTQDLKKTVTNFKYWMDQPGDDSMCYWSENHQILFSSAEYLMGHYYKDDIFTNTGLTGEKHCVMGKERVLIWLEQRFQYGFTEWYSSTYYVEDIAPLSVLVDFAIDEEIRTKATMILDLLIYDLATQNYKGVFAANSGRMYDATKMSGARSSMKRAIAYIWPDFNDYIKAGSISGMIANFYYIKNYKVPEVLVNIGYDQEAINIYKASTGVNLSEYKREGLVGQADNQIMFQLASEAFTNPEVIGNSLKYISKNNMFSNEFVHSFRFLNIGLIKALNLAPLVSKALDSQYDGAAIQRANTYMYRTPDYAMSTAQAYHPGMYGGQHSLFSLNINNDFNIFVQQPAAPLSEGGALGNSPNYWVGNGFHPHVVQEKNVSINLFVLPKKANLIGNMVGVARKIENYTHAYFPRQYMDEVVVEGNYVFGKIKDVYVALIGKNDLVYKTLENTEYDKNKGFTDNYDVIQQGRETYWITEVGTSKEFESFSTFMEHIKSQEVAYVDETLTYKNLKLKYKGDFIVDGEIMELEYKRFESKYAITERKAKNIIFQFNGQSLDLNFNDLIRKINN